MNYDLEIVKNLNTGVFVAGSFVDGEQTIETIDPSTNSVICHVSAASIPMAEEALTSAENTFNESPWRDSSITERSSFLSKIADIIDSKSKHLAVIEAINTGKPIGSAHKEISGAANVFRYYAGAIGTYSGQTIPLDPKLISTTFLEPVGIAAQIVPWNFPLLAASWKLAPALAVGCVCILKTSPLTPLSSLALASILKEAGVPDGVVSILPGGPELGDFLANDPRVAAVSFTGSTEIGSKIMASAARDVKRVALELGGKNPALVFGDTDPIEMARSLVPAAFGNCGQSCAAKSNILVEETIYEDFVFAFMQRTKELVLGAPFDEAVEIGPLISNTHWLRVRECIDRAVDQGAKLLYGGGRPDHLEAGNFMVPAVFSDVTPGIDLFKEEVFGPVCSIIRFSGEDEAVALANATEYGLSASVFTRDVSRAFRVVRRLRTGSVSVNGQPSMSRYGVFAPFGGVKKSGVGRELGLHGLEQYSEVKSVFWSL